LSAAWRLAAVPTRRSPFFVNATTDGVVRPPSAFGTTVASPPSMTAMQEFVVPKSIPRTLDISCLFLFSLACFRQAQMVSFFAFVPFPMAGNFATRISRNHAKNSQVAQNQQVAKI